MNKLILLMIVLAFSVSVYSYEPKSQFKQANDLFNNGQYSQAAEIYTALIDNGYKESDIYYNLGNSYFRLEKIPLAILNFERARRLDPGDEDINFNLKLANLRIIDKFEPVPTLFFIEWYEQAVRLFYSGNWAIILVVSTWLFFISLIFLFYSQIASIRRIVLITTILSFFVILISGFFGYKAYIFENDVNQGIIFQPSVYVKSAPDPGSTDLFILHEGTKIYVTESIDNWIQIKVENGDIGWIKKNEIETI
jgi:tetratricopeptide (TPR) repeat protein